MTNSRINIIVENVLELLVAGKYRELEMLSGGRRLSAEEIETGINEFPYRPVMPPKEQLSDLVDIIEVKTLPNSYSVWIALWTEEEGRSDLSLRLTISDLNTANSSVEIDDLLVP